MTDLATATILAAGNLTVMVGSQQDAETARELARRGMSWKRTNLPGWEGLDAGSYRGAYRSPDGIVYKIAHSTSYDHQAYAEMERWKMLRRHPDWSRYAPDASIWVVAGQPVTAVEYVPHESSRTVAARSPHGYNDMLNAVHHVGGADMQGDNWRVRADQSLVATDLGNGLLGDAAGCEVCRPADTSQWEEFNGDDPEGWDLS